MLRRKSHGNPAALLLTLLALVCGAASVQATDSPEARAPYFVDVAAAAGVEHAYTGDWEHYVGGGVAAFDCDLDGDPDLFFAGGTAPSALYRNVGTTGALRFSAVAGSELVGPG